MQERDGSMNLNRIEVGDIVSVDFTTPMEISPITEAEVIGIPSYPGDCWILRSKNRLQSEAFQLEIHYVQLFACMFLVKKGS